MIGIAFGQSYSGQSFGTVVANSNTNHISAYFQWGDLEPTEGTYNWTAIDALVAQAAIADVDVLVGVKTQNSWGVAYPDIQGGSMPNDLDTYYDFVYAMVLRANGKVRYWTRDWEAHGSSEDYWSGTLAQYAQIQAQFYAAVKAADPTATVILGGHTGVFTGEGVPVDDETMTTVITNCGDYCDAIDVRLYRDFYSIGDRLDWFQALTDKPIYCTESGGPTPQDFPIQFSAPKAIVASMI